MDRLRGTSSLLGSSPSPLHPHPHAPPHPHSHHQTNPGQQAEQFPKSLIEQYLRASGKIKKFERAGFFKRFAPSAGEVQADFQRLAYSFEESGIGQYAAMCHIGFAKCEAFGGAAQREAEAYLRAARCFRGAHSEHAGFREAALHCYQRAAERATDGCVVKAAILRELRPLQRQMEGTSSLTSPPHQIHDLETSAEASGAKGDYRSALQHYDDIVDHVYERRGARMYGDLLRRVEVLRLLLLVHLNLPPARQSPAHIKLIEHYYGLAQFELEVDTGAGAAEERQRPGAFVPEQQQYALAEITAAWVEGKMCDLRRLLRDFGAEFASLSPAERQLLRAMHTDLGRSY
ncbi:hypothetical protein KR018_007590 [Drosophila ironensis]|nr:hypothetical protein KR018_007590 [Drosophila ironensis]